MKNEPIWVAKGEVVSENEYAIRLLRNTFVNLSSFKATKGRGFEVFKWHVESEGPHKLSGWFPWVEYKGKRWSKDRKFLWANVKVGPPMIPMHKFFKSAAEFGKWVGEKNFKHLFNELI